MPEAGDHSTRDPHEATGGQEVFNVQEAAAFLRVCERTVRTLISEGTLKSFHVRRSIRISRQALRDYVARQERDEDAK